VVLAAHDLNVFCNARGVIAPLVNHNTLYGWHSLIDHLRGPTTAPTGVYPHNYFPWGFTLVL